MMIIEDQEHFDKVRKFARCVGAEAELQKQLDFLAGFGGDAAKVRCHLYRDFAPHSFFWRMEHSSLDGWKPGLVGGLIYSGPGAPSDGSAPSFSVSLNPDAASGKAHVVHPHLSKNLGALLIVNCPAPARPRSLRRQTCSISARAWASSIPSTSRRYR